MAVEQFLTPFSAATLHIAHWLNASVIGKELKTAINIKQDAMVFVFVKTKSPKKESDY